MVLESPAALPPVGGRRNISAMNKRLLFLLPVLCAVALLAADESKIPPMPEAVTDNAVASLKNGLEMYSLMGIGTKKTWDSITNKMFILQLRSGKWVEGR